MENKDTKADYQKVVMTGDQKWEMVASTIGIIFLFEIHIHYFYIYGEFSSPTWKKSPHAKNQFPSKILNWPI